MNNGPIFITGTYRSGSTFLSRILNAHEKISLTYDSVNYFRWYVKKDVDPKFFKTIVLDIKNRLNTRYGMSLESEQIITNLNAVKKISHKDIYIEVMKSLNQKVKIWGEKTLLEWTNIPLFLTYLPNGKVIQIIRDPRAVTASYKHMTIEPNNRFLDAAFCCLSSLSYGKKYQHILGKDQYLLIKYEDLMDHPVEVVKNICNFLEIKFSPKLLNPENHIDMFGNILTKKKHSSFPGSKMKENWSTMLTTDEISFIETVCHSYMLSFGYTDKSKEVFNNNFLNNVILKDELLAKRYSIFQLLGQGVEEYPSDPTIESNWGSDNSDPTAVGAKALYGKEK